MSDERTPSANKPESRRWRKKPVVIEAMQYNGENWVDIWNWAMSFGRSALPLTFHETRQGTVRIATLEGIMEANRNDWVIRGVKGEFYPCKPDIFEATYEPAE